jgi:hypothetical protein
MTSFTISKMSNGAPFLTAHRSVLTCHTVVPLSAALLLLNIFSKHNYESSENLLFSDHFVNFVTFGAIHMRGAKSSPCCLHHSGRVLFSSLFNKCKCFIHLRYFYLFQTYTTRRRNVSAPPRLARTSQDCFLLCTLVCAQHCLQQYVNHAL